MQLQMTSGSPNQKWTLVLARDTKADGRFVYAVKSTGVFCRPSCPSRRPKRENVEFFDLPTERSEEHTSELQSHLNLVCRLLLEKKKKTKKHERRQRPT